MRVRLAQTNSCVGDLRGNLAIISQQIMLAYQSKCDVVVFPELATVGYPPRDLLYSRTLWKNHPVVVEEILKLLRAHPQQLTVIVGGLHEQLLSGGRYARYNAAWILDRHYGKRVVHKRLLPCYDVFDETRYFTAENGPYAPIPIRIHNPITQRNGTHVGRDGYDVLCDVLICEDIWNSGYQSPDWLKPHTYSTDPVGLLARLGPLFVLNGSPFWVGKIDETRDLVESVCVRIGQPVIWCNQVGAHDDLVTGGYSMVSIPHQGKAVTRIGKPFEVDGFEIRLSDTKTHHSNLNEDRDFHADLFTPPQFFGKPVNRENFDVWTVYKALYLHMHDYKQRCGFTEAVIGLSGGIDSAVVAVIAADVFGPENVIGIGMPSPYSSEGSIEDAQVLAKNLGIRFFVNGITGMYEATKAVLLSGGKQKFINPVTDENLQPRLRGMLLMAYSNEGKKCLLLTTGNKSEISVGYCVDGCSRICTDQGILTAEKLYEAVSSGSLFSINNNKITNAHKTVKDRQLTISSVTGLTIRVSDDHEVKVFRPLLEKEEFCLAKDICVGDYLVANCGSNIWGSNNEIPTWNFTKSKWDFRSKEFVAPGTLMESVAKFLGICVADGCYSGTGIYRIRTSKKEVSDFVGEVLTRLLGSDCWRITSPDCDGCYFIEITSVQMVAWLKHIDVRHGAHKKVVPGIILTCSAGVVCSFLGGVFLDATTNSSKNLSEITYHSVSYTLAKDVHLLLFNLGVFCYLRDKNPSSGRYWEVYVPSSETQKLFSLGILKLSLTDQIDKNVSNRRKTKGSFDLVFGHESELEELYRVLGWKEGRSIKNIIAASKKSRGVTAIGRTTLMRYLNLVPEDSRGGFWESLHRLTISSTRYISVTSIVEKNEYLDMYDFSMAGKSEYNLELCKVHNCTLYGDMCGGLAVLSDVWKSMGASVFALARFFNKCRGEVIPLNTIEKPPSAELKPDQQDTDTLPPYEQLDPLLQMLVEDELTPDEVVGRLESQLESAVLDISTVQLVHRIYKMYRNSEFKRRQMPDGPKVQKRSFGSGRRMPIAMKLTTVKNG